MTELTLRRVIDAPVQRVYAAWTDPELLKQWLAPGNAVASRAVAHVAVGGTFLIEMRGTDGQRWLARGLYREVAPLRRLVHTWRWEGSDTETRHCPATSWARATGCARSGRTAPPSPTSRRSFSGARRTSRSGGRNWSGGSRRFGMSRSTSSRIAATSWRKRRRTGSLRRSGASWGTRSPSLHRAHVPGRSSPATQFASPQVPCGTGNHIVKGGSRTVANEPPSPYRPISLLTLTGGSLVASRRFS